MRRDEVQRLLLKPSPQGARKQLGKNRGGQGLEEKRTTTNNAFALLQHHGLSLFSSRQMKDNHATMSPELPQDPMLFSLKGTPLPPHAHRHTRKIQTVARGHVRVAPVICQPITRLSRARLQGE